MGAPTQELPGNLSCLNNYETRADCTWVTEGPVGDGPFYLNFTNVMPNETTICMLTASEDLPHWHHGAIHVLYPFSELDCFQVSLHGGFSEGNRTYIAFQEYKPRLYIKCDPPSSLQSNFSADKCQLRWSVPAFLEPILQYELEFKEQNESWEQALHKNLFNSATRVEIEATEFRAGITYIARVRCKTSRQLTSYKSQWSEWSQTTAFQRAVVPDLVQLPEELFSTRVLQFLFIPIGLSVILYLVFSCKFPSRAKSITCQSIPTPAAFFQPLYTLHNGNFKDWVGPKEECGQVRRHEASDLSKVSAEAVADPSAHEVISQISLKSLAKTSVALQEDGCAPASSPAQQYMGAKEAAVGLAALLPHDHVEAGALAPLEGSEMEDGSPDMEGSPLLYLQQGEADLYVLQRSLELESLSFCSNDYCTLCDGDAAGSSIPAEWLQLLEGGSLPKHPPSGVDAALLGHQV
ncbi:PREDICTED: interleukin-9 receptor-like [Crocodylus porosus]|uniref:interleukin-9 receptor-like n=1 Tax=Crocodylus porosus TaxID=8502 RepID=UPI000939073A|nr:PREDICTED: interleukin-9 receptor-like [Crocodylus porosus]